MAKFEFRVVWSPGTRHQEVTACKDLAEAERWMAIPRTYTAEIQSRPVVEWQTVRRDSGPTTRASSGKDGTQ